MPILTRTVLVAIVVLAGAERIPRADSSGCPSCGSNSPILNPFPILGIRWGTSRVLKGSRACPINEDDHATIAIARITAAQPPTVTEPPTGIVRGYQLSVVDGGGRELCRGSQLTGVIFVLADNRQPVVVQQIAKTPITSDPARRGAPPAGLEYRVVYYLADSERPDASLCTTPLRGLGLLRRAWRWLTRHRLPSFASSEVSPTLDDLFEVFPDQLTSYAVLIPDAEYNAHGDPFVPRSTGLRAIGAASYRSLGQPALEWFEFACAGGALAHTDLSGLVALDDPKEVRTAALRMFQAKYHGDRSETVTGIPISYTRDVAPATDAAVELDPDIEARWDERGAVCISHSRLWMRDSIISNMSDYHDISLAEGERRFVAELHSRPCTPELRGYFTSYVMHHVDAAPKPSPVPWASYLRYLSLATIRPTHRSPRSPPADAARR